MLVGRACGIFVAVREVDVAKLAFPLHVVHLLLKIFDANAEVAQLFRKFRREAVDHGLLLCIDLIFLRHGFGDHLRHLVARDFVLAAVGAVAVPFDDAVVGKLGDSVIRPVIGGHVAEGVRRRRGEGGGGEEGGAESRTAYIFFHERQPFIFFLLPGHSTVMSFVSR